MPTRISIGTSKNHEHTSTNLRLNMFQYILVVNLKGHAQKDGSLQTKNHDMAIKNIVPR